MPAVMGRMSKKSGWWKSEAIKKSREPAVGKKHINRQTEKA